VAIHRSTADQWRQPIHQADRPARVKAPIHARSPPRQKRLQLLVRGKPATESTDRVKPADILNETGCRKAPFNQTRFHRPHHHQLRRLHAPAVKSGFPHASTPEQIIYVGGRGDVGTIHVNDTSYIIRHYNSQYSARLSVHPNYPVVNEPHGATRQQAIAKTPAKLDSKWNCVICSYNIYGLVSKSPSHKLQQA
jgi:hypothetical protein